MIAELMLYESLVLTLMIHNRYHAAKRNPFNEIECSDHYARAMASYGTFIAACGFTYHGPQATIGFAPKLQKEEFSAPYTSAGSWGNYFQKKTGKGQVHELELAFGELKLQRMNLELIDKSVVQRIIVSVGGKRVAATFNLKGDQLAVILKPALNLRKSDSLKIEVIC